MTPPDGGMLKLDTAQETFEGIMPYQREVPPPVTGLTQWAYSLVIEGGDHAVPFRVKLFDPRTGEEMAGADADEGIASIEVELREGIYQLAMEVQHELPFRAICTQTYGYRE